MSNVDSICSGLSTQRKAEFDCEDDIPPTGKPCIDFQPDDRWHIKEETADSTVGSDTAVHDRTFQQNKVGCEENLTAGERLQINHNSELKVEPASFNGDVNRTECTENAHTMKEETCYEDCASSNNFKESVNVEKGKESDLEKDSADINKESVDINKEKERVDEQKTDSMGETRNEQDPPSVCNTVDTSSCSSSSSHSTSHEKECENATLVCDSTAVNKDSVSEQYEQSHKAVQNISMEKSLQDEECRSNEAHSTHGSGESSSNTETFQNERKSLNTELSDINSNANGENKLNNSQSNEKATVQNGQENSTDSAWDNGVNSSTSTNTLAISGVPKTACLDNKKEDSNERDKKIDCEKMDTDKEMNMPDSSVTETSEIKMECEDSSSISRDPISHEDNSTPKSDDKEVDISGNKKNVDNIKITSVNKNGENSNLKHLLSVVKSEAEFKKSLNENIPQTEGAQIAELKQIPRSKIEIGKYSPVQFPVNGKLLMGADEVILESPSFLVPLVLKEPNKFPRLEKKEPANDSPSGKHNDCTKMFNSSAGQFLISLGLSRVKEWYHKDMKKLKARQIRKQGKQVDLEAEYQEHKQAFLASKQANVPFTFPLKKCEICEFKTESKVVMEAHYSIPHLTSRREYRCNYCTFCTRDPAGILLHFKALHGKLASLELPMQYHECHFCPFQSHLKAKVNSHMNKCQKNFVSAHNQAPPIDFDFPSITAKPVTFADIEKHRAYAANTAKASSVKITLAPQGGLQKGNARKRLAAVLNKLTANQNAQLYKQMVSKSHTVIKPLIISQQSQQQSPAPPPPPPPPPQPPASQQHLQQVTPGGIQLPPGIVITRPRVPPNTRQVNTPPTQIMLPRSVNPVRQVISSSRKLVPLLNNKAFSAANAPQISITPTTKVPSATTASTTTTPTGQQQGTTSPQPVALFTNLALGGSTTHTPISVSQSLNKSGVVVTVQSKPPQSSSVRGPRLQSPYQRHTAPPSHGAKGTTSGNSFVMCEICDAYIRDLEELRSHMQSVHKVKIHPKMLVSRPPLNCQKCQWRFFTDQGLERHLLGAHGLVTSNMQELANRSQDGGRCLICGAVFTYKLVNHMTLVHKVTLKPAHLSYKCTVCTATFALYRLFENHVYTIHSGAVKRLNDENSVQPNKKIKVSQPEQLVSGKSAETTETNVETKCYHCGEEVVNMQAHLKKHLKKCSVKLCKIEKCQKCLCSFDGMLVLYTSDFGLDDDEDDDDEEQEKEDKPKNNNASVEKDNQKEVSSDQNSDMQLSSGSAENVIKVTKAEETEQKKDEPDVDKAREQVESTDESQVKKLSQLEETQVNRDANFEEVQEKDSAGKDSDVKDALKDETQIKDSGKGESQVNDSEESESQLNDSAKGESQVNVSAEGESQVNDSAEGESQVNDSAEGESQVNDSAEGESQVNDSAEGESQVNDSAEGESHVNDSAEVESHVNDSAEGESQINDSAEGETQVNDSTEGETQVNDSVKDKSAT